MSHQSDRKEKIDENFREVITLLNNSNLNYWLCHGTLLGVIRDQCLIPWDHDVDIAMWAKPESKETVSRLMLSNGFLLKSDGEDYDFLSFTKQGGREIDFNFYRIAEETQIAYSEWFIPRSKFVSLLSALSKGMEYNGKYGGVVRSCRFLSPIFTSVVDFLKRNNKFYKSAGYTTPAGLLKNIKLIQLDDLMVRVPLMSDEVLEFVYGSGWRTPQRVYDWTKESPSTKISNSRF